MRRRAGRLSARRGRHSSRTSAARGRRRSRFGRAVWTVRIRNSRGDLHASAMTRVTGDVLLSLRKWQVARVQKIISTVRKSPGHLFQHSEHAARDLFFWIAVTREVAIGCHVTVRALHAKRRIEGRHDFRDIDVGRQHAEIRARCRRLLSLSPLRIESS